MTRTGRKLLDLVLREGVGARTEAARRMGMAETSEKFRDGREVNVYIAHAKTVREGNGSPT
jgi:hypothetical protein